MNDKWYLSQEADSSPVISSRVRLARNLTKYPFSVKIDNDQSKAMIGDVVGSIKNSYMAIGKEFDFVDLSDTDNVERLSMLEKHEISPELLRYERPVGVLVKNDDSIDIMINEEDHIRIQAIYPGNNIEKAYDMADKIDDCIEESLEYAYHKDFGYLTSCPTNTGTGLRASVMVHLPMLEKTGNLQRLAAAIAKLGMTVRGIYGEGTQPMGSIYQISNQITLGKTESEIIENLQTTCCQVIDNEFKIQKAAFTNNADDMEDSIYRALGILSSARKMSLTEAMEKLSTVRLGIIAGVVKEKRPNMPIYSIMMNIEPGNLQKRVGYSLSESQMMTERARYLREIFE